MFTPKSKDRLLNHGLMQSDALIRCNIPMQQILENLEHTLHCVSWSKFQYTSGEIALSRTKLWIWTFGIRAQKINYHSDLYTVSPQQEIAWLLAWDFSNNFWRRLLQNCDETADLRFSQRCSNVNFWFSSFQYAGLCSVYFSNPISNPPEYQIKPRLRPLTFSSWSENYPEHLRLKIRKSWSYVTTVVQSHSVRVRCNLHSRFA